MHTHTPRFVGPQNLCVAVTFQLDFLIAVQLSGQLGAQLDTQLDAQLACAVTASKSFGRGNPCLFPVMSPRNLMGDLLKAQ